MPFLQTSQAKQRPRAARRPRARAAIGADVLFNKPWLITESGLSRLVLDWQASLVIEDGPSPADLLRAKLAAAGENDDSPDYEFPVIGGIAAIPITGPLTSGQYWFSTSYSEIQQMCSDAVADPNISGLLMVFDSPGGEAASEWADLVDYLYDVKQQKPLYAIANDAAYSAAYGLASAASRVFINRLGGLGSIGCWVAHTDMSQALDKAGIKVTLIAAGKRKTDGNPFEPLSHAAAKDLQDSVDRVRSLFIDQVSRNRGVSADSLYKTEAACFMAEKGIPLLGDAVGSLSDALASLRQQVPAKRSLHASVPAAPMIETGDAKFLTNLVSSPALVGVGRRFRDEATSIAASYGAAEGRLLSFPSSRARILAGSGGSPSQLEILAVPYNQLSGDLGGFREKYSPGCFAGGLQDARVLFCHDERYVIARQSASTVVFTDEKDGLHAMCTPPNTTWANDVLISMARGDIRESSAAFWILQAKWEQRSGERVRVIERALLREVSVHSFAAYPTSQAKVLPATALAPASTDLGRTQREVLLLQGGLSDVERLRIELELLRLR